MPGLTTHGRTPPPALAEALQGVPRHWPWREVDVKWPFDAHLVEVQRLRESCPPRLRDGFLRIDTIALRREVLRGPVGCSVWWVGVDHVAEEVLWASWGSRPARVVNRLFQDNNAEGKHKHVSP